MYGKDTESRLKKIARITAGFVLIPIGLLLSIPGVPGPGLAIVFFGLVLLSEHFEWAQRAVVWCKAKFNKLLKRDGQGSKSSAA